eukprot:SAG22_NODE_8931_length_620_cov_1.376200_2_plen_81_part_00
MDSMDDGDGPVRLRTQASIDAQTDREVLYMREQEAKDGHGPNLSYYEENPCQSESHAHLITNSALTFLTHPKSKLALEVF